ncbi:aminoglycoside phosphotransferase family protein [Microbacterium atlanticum]|uniref:aminoglycoside phosphotransferase family protein n=1 Tax=Microbacterium atlanticum TaxID=2782168 RepID=UPI001889180D|nr:aminoglycoside phosphotransferase family protein [Microbacterium atlanticum]
MPDRPAAEVRIDRDLIRDLLAGQAEAAIPGASALPLAKVAEGWDSEIWRLGARHAVRLPRRAAAAPLVLHEQLVLPGIAERLAASGVRVPAPLVAGSPAAGYPWAWSVVPWIEGARAMDEPVSLRGAWAETLARTLAALHVEAPPGYPLNPYRGVPLETRSDAVAERLTVLRAAETLSTASAQALDAVWRTGVAAAPWMRPAVWLHGDLHPGNLVVRDGRLSGIIDFGDVTAGDPAYDLAVAWLAFDAGGRARFRAATGERYDLATWRRAHAWAAAVALMLLAHSDDDPAYFALGRDAAAEVVSDRPR